jgi:intracellular septation protein
MKLLIDFFPVLLFFVAYKVHDIYFATAVLIAATFVQVGYVWLKTRKIETMHLITLVLILVFGGATLWLQDEAFIKWKPTVVNWLFGAAFLFTQIFGKKTLIERMMGGNISLPETVWPRLNMAWGLFFLSLGGVNLYVVRHFDTETWVNFKLFGMLGLTVAFIVLQSIYLSRYLQETATEE